MGHIGQGGPGVAGRIIHPAFRVHTAAIVEILSTKDVKLSVYGRRSQPALRLGQRCCRVPTVFAIVIDFMGCHIAAADGAPADDMEIAVDHIARGGIAFGEAGGGGVPSTFKIRQNEMVVCINVIIPAGIGFSFWRPSASKMQRAITRYAGHGLAARCGEFRSGFPCARQRCQDNRCVCFRSCLQHPPAVLHGPARPGRRARKPRKGAQPILKTHKLRMMPGFRQTIANLSPNGG